MAFAGAAAGVGVEAGAGVEAGLVDDELSDADAGLARESLR